jgi:hypothetical protein
MANLGDLARLIRSKNAGPFNLTFDIMFETEAAYRRAADADVITRESVGRLYQVPAEAVVLVHYDAARAIKFSIPRPVPSCDLEDADCYGGQQYGPLVELEIPDE